MKKSKISILLFGSLILGGLASCDWFKSDEPEGPKETPLPATYSLMKNWAGNPSEEIYQVAEADDKTTIAYTDATGELSGGWEYVSRSFAFDSQYVAKFSEYKKITFTGKLETTSGSNVVMVKVEGAGGTFEKKFNFAAESKTYEFGLSFVSDWSNVSSMLFFVDRETSDSGSGVMTFTNIALSKEEVVDEYNIAKGMPSVPQDYTIYHGGDDVSVMYRWGYDATEEITAEQVEGAYKFTWNGMNSEWNYVSALVKGDDDNAISASGFQRVYFKVNGTAGQKALFKFQLKDNSKAVEKTVDLTGEDQEVELDITSVLAAAVVDEYLIGIFPAPGLKGEGYVGELTLKECKLDKTAVYVEPVTNKTDFNTIFLNSFDKVDACYTATTEGNKVTVQLAKSAVGWESLQAKVKKTEDWFNLTDYSRLYGVVTSDKDTHIMVKPYDSQEFKYELKANTPVVIDETVTATPDETKVTPIFISMDEGDALDANVTIDGLRFVKPTANVEFGTEVLLTKSPTADGKHTITPTTTGMSLAYEKAAPGWEAIEVFVSGNYAKLNALRGTVTSSVDTHLLLKPADNGANEHWLELKAGVPQTFDFKFTPGDNPTWACKHVMFVCTNEGDALSGIITFENFIMYENSNGVSSLPNVGDYGSIMINNYYRADECYEISRNGSDVTVAYNKPQAGGWESMAAHITKGDGWYPMGDYTKVMAKLVADVDVKVLLKAYDNGAGEHWVDLKAGVAQEVIYHVTSAVAESGADFIVFICAGDNAGAASGHVTISGLRVMREDANGDFEAGKIYVNSVAARDFYTATATEDGKGLVLDYQVASVDYHFSEFFISSNDVEKFNHVSFTIKTTSKVTILLKPADNGANEQNATIEPGVEVPVSFDFIPGSGQWACKMPFSIAHGAGDALSGKIIFSNFLLSIVGK